MSCSYSSPPADPTQSRQRFRCSLRLAKSLSNQHSYHSMERKIKVNADFDALVLEAAERIVDLSTRTIAEKGAFSMALSGGHTPEELYALLASKPYLPRI